MEQMRLMVYLSELSVKNLIRVSENECVKNLGRWHKKNDVEHWMLNYHPEPGYKNKNKDIWIKKLK